MKKVRVKFCDGFTGGDDVFLPILRRHYDVELAETPDYVIYSVFGDEDLKYPDAVRIFTTGECRAPDFNACDYATGFDHIDFGDRYLRLPLCSIMFRNGQNMIDLAKDRGRGLPDARERGFCSFVVSNANGMPERMRMFEMLNAYRRVDSGGAWLNNVGGMIADKCAFEHAHKFALCFENERHPGYCTEKLVDAFASGTVPIYLGDPRVGEMFNTRAFVNVGDFPSMEAAVERVKALDRDTAAYTAMLREPVFSGGAPGIAELERFLCKIFDQDLDRARRRPSSPYAAYWKPMSAHVRIARLFQVTVRSVKCRLSKLGGRGHG